MNPKKKLIIGMSILFLISSVGFVYTLYTTANKKSKDVVARVDEYFPGQGETVYSAIHNEVAHFVVKERLATNEWYIVFSEIQGDIVYVKAICANDIILDVAYNPITEECNIVEE